jgi:hypothetical protein
MRDAGTEIAVLEATSHGLAQHRVTGCAFDVAVVTNITHEHLDFHGTHEAYREAKASLFEEEGRSGTAREDFLLRRLNPSSFFFFSGGTGLVLGILAGAFAGASDFLSGIAKALPDSLAMLLGTLMGGIVFAAFGGFLGFIVLGGLGALQAFLFNGISGIMGGFRVTLDRAGVEDKESREED